MRITLKKARQAILDGNCSEYAAQHQARNLRDLAEALWRNPLAVQGQRYVGPDWLKLALQLAGFSFIQDHPFGGWDNGEGVYAFQGAARRPGLSARGIPWHFTIEDDEIVSVAPGPPWWKRTVLDTSDYHDLLAYLSHTPHQAAYVAVCEDAAGDTVVLVLSCPDWQDHDGPAQ
ncbi:MAG: hypothetical protein KKA73_06465 [Chloroflexi bacterium]|nr:hypothetical protein [Chloroflexota bacterium]MBU1747314.1 hypothetical protein [Chloroflexota bacterium]